MAVKSTQNYGWAALPSPEGHVCSRADSLDAHVCTSSRLAQRAARDVAEIAATN